MSYATLETTSPTVYRQIFVVQDDPDDNKFIGCAIECRADYIVSGDTHLLNLKEFEGIKILRVSEFLKIFYKQKP
ncbi:MAG: putative toxin-antitoxin system toxin component, PIN family [Nitrospirota bacterium]|nr:putative toxin-antitoxin system toxin component, PIN family [Nitrospirota bacterium]